MHPQKWARVFLSVLASVTLAAQQGGGRSSGGGRTGDNTSPSGPSGPVGGRLPAMNSYGVRGSVPRSASEHVMTLGFISRSAKEIGKRRGKEIPELLPLVEQIQSDVKFLQAEWSRWGQQYGGSAPVVPLELDPYYRSLVGTSTALKQAQKLPGPELLNVVRNIARDIRNKATNCENSSDGLGKQILVTAKTVKANGEVPGFEVFYVPMALLGQKGEHKRFPTISSPATHNNVPPGFYAIWLRRDNTTNIYTAQDILGDSQGKCTLEIAISNDFHAAR